MKPIPAEDKKKLDNEKRLLSIKKWQKSVQLNSNSLKSDFNTLDEKTQLPNKRVVFEDAADSPANAAHKDKSFNNLNSEVKKKLTLFDESSDSEDDAKYFAIKPQFEGERGQHLLEMNAQFSERFKLDERFKDDDNEYPQQEKLEEDVSDKSQDPVNNERLKNFEILEQVLGFQVPGKELTQDNKLHRKRLMRFDPDDENTSKFLKTSDHKKGDKKKKNKIEDVKDEAKSDVPISTERFYEVSSDLKTILGSSSGQFSLSQKFDDKVEDNIKLPITDKAITKPFGSQVYQKTAPIVPTNGISEVKEIKRIKFFISKDDPRLKEGIEFFTCTKPLEDIREEWSRNKHNVMELLKRKRKMSQRMPSLKTRAIQRKQNYARRK